MQKIVRFLENNVEWVAIALGTLFLLYMVYDYALLKPVTVTVGGSVLTPGQVDDKTLTGPARQLDAKLKDLAAPPMPVQNFLGAEQVAFNDTSETQLGKPWTEGYLRNVMNQILAPAPVEQIAANPVTNLPEAPAPVDVKTSDGRSTVVIPQPPSVAGAEPVATATAAANTGVDCNWVSVGATLPIKKLAENFTASKIPVGALNSTTLLRVQLLRQEQDAEGNWGPETMVQPLQNVTLQPMVTAAAKPFEAAGYDAWVQTDQTEIAQPPFYQVVQADPWRIPGGQILQPVLADLPFDPSKVTNEHDLTPEQRKIYEAYLKQLEQQKLERVRQNYLNRNRGGGSGGPPGGGPPGGFGGGPGGPGGGGGGGGGGFGGPGGDVAVDDSAPVLLAQNYRPTGMPPGMPPGMMPGGYPPGMMPGMPRMPPGEMPGMPPMPQPGAANQAIDTANAALLAAAQATLPKGSFTPSVQPDIVVWAHDASVLPGKTYRYRLEYFLKNPVFQTSHLCQPPSLADTFMLVSKPSDWTAAISVQSATNFYAVNASPTKDEVKFDIFSWKGGNWQVDSMEAAPGDLVRASRGDGADKVDFDTGWTLVDVRNDPRNGDNKIIILTTDSGQTLRRDLTVDRANPEYKHLMGEVDAAKTKGAAATPGAGATSAGGQAAAPAAPAARGGPIQRDER